MFTLANIIAGTIKMLQDFIPTLASVTFTFNFLPK